METRAVDNEILEDSKSVEDNEMRDLINPTTFTTTNRKRKYICQKCCHLKYSDGPLGKEVHSRGNCFVQTQHIKVSCNCLQWSMLKRKPPAPHYCIECDCESCLIFT